MNKKIENTPAFKKILKWFSITILALLVLLIIAPFFFKDKIKAIVTKTINDNINATVTFKEIDVSLLKSFPLANLTIDKISVINKKPFEGDTLFFSEEVNLKMKISELFKKADETIKLKSISVKNSTVNIIFNKEDLGNYDIAIKNETAASSAKSDSFSFDIEEYSAENLKFTYFDVNSKMKMSLDNIYHSGKGNFKDDIFEIDTESKANLSFEKDGTKFMNNLAISLDAIIAIDLKNSKYTFKENTGFINQLPLEFNGSIQLVDENQLYDLSFKTPTSSFKNLLALIPAEYAGNLNSIKTEGDFNINGVVKGTLSEKTIPAFDISFASKKAMFKYADLPKSVQNININYNIVNKTGLLNDTYVNIEKLTFTIDKDVFSANGKVFNIAENPQINLEAKGNVNLENVSKVYPISLDKKLTGILKVAVITAFDMNSIEKGNYQNIKNSGNMSLSNFKYEGIEFSKPFFIDNTSIIFNPNQIKLKEFTAKTGDSDLDIKGNLDNFYGFLFKNQVLKGDFTLNSNLFKMSDFMSDNATNDDTKKGDALKIPSFLDCTFSANAKKVVYDTMDVSNVTGVLIVKEETVRLQNLKMDVFGGNIGMNGLVSTKQKVSNFTMALNLKELNISESFSQLEMLKSIAPIAKTIEGKINSTINLSGNLTDEMTPDLKTISGNLLGQLLNTKLKASNSKVLSLLDNQVGFFDVGKLDLNEASANLSFNNGEVIVKPFQIRYEDIRMEIGGTHGFDQAMNYTIKFDVPAKYLGTEITNYIQKLSPKDAEKIKSVPINATLTGSFGNPTLKTDVKQATTNLVNQFIQQQKESLLDKGKDALSNLLNKKATEADSTKTKKDTSDKIKDVLNLFKKKKNN
ncbi:hypothetical protein BTO04_02865 [Polaribacter sp. SA4-10]|uniref:AsmA-like C-terminal region-containing protein n=1 Tax=Polaribacter sp. SA4-10 TaxID=754397 RepID=UPI000B3C46C3|nr:AsmA-like C-terminal region-containing protein [Polaribacter sp. SA4-10]ARV05702.1 hypothetical protein BTO04_02865 [Polaribacter sp. SA4-10]